MVYHLIGYRRKTVKENIKLALPHLSEKEQLAVQNRFYRHFCDIFMEMIKTLSMSPKEMTKRFRLTNPELVDEYEIKGKSIMLLAAHYANWEWLIALNLKFTFECTAVYKKIANDYFDKLVRDIRSRYNTQLVVTSKTIQLIADNHRKGKLSVYGLISDQSPKASQTAHYDHFMGIEVPVHVGPELLSKKYDLNVLYVQITKVKRGYYEATLIPICEDAKKLPSFEIIHRYISEVEKQILETPEYYFWTHRRWKHRKQE